jgi:ABC-type nitrate/sulfonate/bicarbonate transport system permease component
MATPLEKADAVALQVTNTIPRPMAGRKRNLRVLRFIALPLLLLLVWQITAKLQLINPLFLPPIDRVARAAYQLLVTGDLYDHFISSFVRILYANLIAICLAVPLGFMIGLYLWLEDLLDPLVNLLRPIPPLAWIPLAILWFGVGEKSVVFITFISAFFAILLNTIVGVRSVEKSLVRAALSLGATRWILIRQVILPATLPYLFTGFRIALGVSWMSIVAAEMIAATSGLGFLISYYRELLRSDLILVGMISIGAIGFLMDRGLLWLERKLLPWRVSLKLG